MRRHALLMPMVSVAHLAACGPASSENDGRNEPTQPTSQASGAKDQAMSTNESLPEEFRKTLRSGSVIIRPERDPTLVAGKDGSGRYVADPRTGRRFYDERTGHMDPRGQFYVRDGSGEVVFWGHYRADVTADGIIIGYIQSMYSGSGRRNKLDPKSHDLGSIPSMYLSFRESHYWGKQRDIIIIDERRYWFERGNA